MVLPALQQPRCPRGQHHALVRGAALGVGQQRRLLPGPTDAGELQPGQPVGNDAGPCAQQQRIGDRVRVWGEQCLADAVDAPVPDLELGGGHPHVRGDRGTLGRSDALQQPGRVRLAPAPDSWILPARGELDHGPVPGPEPADLALAEVDDPVPLLRLVSGQRPVELRALVVDAEHHLPHRPVQELVSLVHGPQNGACAVLDQVVRPQPEDVERCPGQFTGSAVEAVLRQLTDHPPHSEQEAHDRGALGERPVGVDRSSQALGEVSSQTLIGQVADQD